MAPHHVPPFVRQNGASNAPGRAEQGRADARPAVYHRRTAQPTHHSIRQHDQPWAGMPSARAGPAGTDAFVVALRSCFQAAKPVLAMEAWHRATVQAPGCTSRQPVGRALPVRIDMEVTCEAPKKPRRKGPPCSRVSHTPAAGQAHWRQCIDGSYAPSCADELITHTRQSRPPAARRTGQLLV